MKYTYYQLGIMAAVVSFLGFVVENIWLAMTKGYINNRNMNAPFLLGYGLLILFMYAVFGTPAAFKMFTKEKVRWKRYLLYFLCSFVVVCIGEIVLGIAVEAPVSYTHLKTWRCRRIILPDMHLRHRQVFTFYLIHSLMGLFPSIKHTILHSAGIL